MGCSNSTITKEELQRLKSKIAKLEQEREEIERKSSKISKKSNEIKNLNKQVSLKKTPQTEEFVERRQINSFSPSSWQPSIDTNPANFKPSLEVSEIKKMRQDNSDDSILVIKEVSSQRINVSSDKKIDQKSPGKDTLEQSGGENGELNNSEDTKKILILTKENSKELTKNKISLMGRMNSHSLLIGDETLVKNAVENFKLNEEKFSIHINGVLLCTKKVKFRKGSKTEGAFKKRKAFKKFSDCRLQMGKNGAKNDSLNDLHNKLNFSYGDRAREFQSEKSKMKGKKITYKDVKYFLAKGFKKRKKTTGHVIVKRTKESQVSEDYSINKAIRHQILGKGRRASLFKYNGTRGKRKNSKKKSFKISSITGSRRSNSVDRDTLIDHVGRDTSNNTSIYHHSIAQRVKEVRTEPNNLEAFGQFRQLKLSNDDLKELGADDKSLPNKIPIENETVGKTKLQNKRKELQKTSSLGDQYLKMLSEMKANQKNKEKGVDHQIIKLKKKEFSEKESFDLKKVMTFSKKKSNSNEGRLVNPQDEIIGDLNNRADTPNPGGFSQIDLMGNDSLKLDNKDNLWKRQNTKAPKLRKKSSSKVLGNISQIENPKKKGDAQNKPSFFHRRHQSSGQELYSNTSYNNFWGQKSPKLKKSESGSIVNKGGKDNYGSRKRKVKIMPLRSYNKKLKEIFKRKETAKRIAMKHKDSKLKHQPVKNASYVVKKVGKKNEEVFKSMIVKKKKGKNFKKTCEDDGAARNQDHPGDSKNDLQDIIGINSGQRVMKFDPKIKKKMTNIFGKSKGKNKIGVFEGFRFKRSRILSIDEQKRQLKKEFRKGN